MRKTSYLFLLIALVSLAGCTERENYPAKDIKRLDKALATPGPMTDSAMLRGASLLFGISGYGEYNDSTALHYASLPSVTVHREAVDSAYGDISQIETGLGILLGRASRMLPRVRVGDAYAIISPFRQSVFTVDSTLYIGLNHYLGAGYAPYDYFPDYIRRRKTPSRILPDIAEAVVRGAYPSGPGGRVLHTLLYEGAVAEAVMRLSGQSEKDVLGYTDGEYAWLEKNEKDMWNVLIARKMLFSLNPDYARGLVAPAPVTSILHPEAPGAAGRFIGHRILRSYLDSYSSVPLDTLLTPGFYTSEDVLKNSHYNP